MRILPLFLLICAGISALPQYDSADAEGAKRHAKVKALAQRADEGDPEALYAVAMLHEEGYDTIAVDTLRAHVLLRLAAQGGYAPAQNHLAFHYLNRIAGKEDADSGLFWLDKAALQGEPRAANNLGYLYLRGEIVPRDIEKAQAYLEAAASAGLPTAQVMLGDVLTSPLFADYHPNPTEADSLRAAELYAEAAAHGNHGGEMKLINIMEPRWEALPADSALNLGKEYNRKHMHHAAVALFEAASRDDNAEAMELLAEAYSKGLGTKYDHEKSLRYYLRAARRGRPSAQRVIAEILEIFPDALNDYDLSPAQRTAAYWYDASRE